MKYRFTFLALILFLSFLKGQELEHIDSLKINLSNSPKDSLSAWLLEIGQYYYHLDRDSSLKYIIESLNSSLLTNDRLHESRAKINIALIKIERNEPAEGESLIKEAMKISEELGDKDGLFMGYSNLGILNHYNADYEVAIDYYLTALELAKAMDNDYEISRINYNMADVFMQNKIIEKKNFYYKQAMKYSKTAFPMVYVLSCNQFADYFTEINLDSASFYLEKAFEIIDEIKAPQALLELYAGKGQILSKRKEYAAAQIANLKSLEYAKQLKQDYYLAWCYCSLGEGELNLSNYNKSSEYFMLYDKHQTITDNSFSASKCLLAWSNLEKAKGNYKKSYELLLERSEIVDSIYSIENRALLTDLETKYETAKKEAEIEKQSAEINQKTYQRNMILGGLSLSVLLSGSFIWGLISRNKRNKKISSQDKDLQIQKIENLEKEKKLLSMSSLLEGQETERIRIAKDLHDGLGGLLTNVKAHFGKIQAEIEKVENLDIYNSANLMIDKAHDEVRRISHNLMPADLRVGGLPVAIRQVIHELRSIHEINTDFDLIGFNETRLDEKIELSVYRIVQELINNVLKYAEASEVFVQLSKFEKELQIVVEDNGVGFDYDNALTSKNGLGLKSIQSRVAQFGGDIDVESIKGKGTSVTINVPL